MRFYLKSVLVSLCLVSCGTVEDPHYRDTSRLELPPNLQPGRESIQQKTSDEEGVIRDSDGRKGLGSLVSMSAAEPPTLKLEQPFDVAWNTLASAFRQSKLEIRDRDRDKGLYYVEFDPDDYVPEDASVLGRMGNLLADDYSKAVYVLTVTREDGETAVTAAKASSAEQGGLAGAVDEKEKPDGAERLLSFLYRKLRDGWTEKE